MKNHHKTYMYKTFFALALLATYSAPKLELTFRTMGGEPVLESAMIDVPEHAITKDGGVDADELGNLDPEVGKYILGQVHASITERYDAIIKSGSHFNLVKFPEQWYLEFVQTQSCQCIRLKVTRHKHNQGNFNQVLLLFGPSQDFNPHHRNPDFPRHVEQVDTDTMLKYIDSLQQAFDLPIYGIAMNTSASFYAFNRADQSIYVNTTDFLNTFIGFMPDHYIDGAITNVSQFYQTLQD